MKRTILASLLALGLFAAVPSFAQDEVADDSAPAGTIVENTNVGSKPAQHSEFYTVLFGSGPIGFLLWLGLFGSFGFFLYLAIDSSILVRPSKIMPDSLIANVQAAMKEGDVVKALDFCKNEPTPMSNILSAGFMHVEEGYDVIQEAVSAAADLEVERIMQHLAWISVAANIAPQLGLLGTVQGMIMAFANLGTGAPDVAALAINISQALYTTAGGLFSAIPGVIFFYLYRNKANKTILRMEATTMELIKDLRNVEVVAEYPFRSARGRRTGGPDSRF